MSGPTHKVYVDESGTKEYSEDGEYPESGGRTRYFVFAGLIITPAEAGRLSSLMKDLKEKCFGTTDVEVKANWLKRPPEREARYLKPFGTTDEELDRLVDDLYRALRTFDGEIVAAVVDKADVQKTYPLPWYAPAIAYECLMQRVQLAMEETGGFAGITVDDMSGATPKGNQYKTNLDRHHRGLRASGSRLIPGRTMDRIGNLSFSDSRSDDRLQLADLAAYAVYRQFVEFGAEWDGKDNKLPVYEYFGRIAPKLRANAEGVFAGYGVAKFPRTTWKRWALGKKKEP